MVGASRQRNTYKYDKSNACILTNNTVLFETQIIHGLVHCFLYLLPVGPTLNEFINILFGL